MLKRAQKEAEKMSHALLKQAKKLHSSYKLAEVRRRTGTMSETGARAFVERAEKQFVDAVVNMVRADGQAGCHSVTKDRMKDI